MGNNNGRIANVDFLRIFSMFTIVVCHATIHLQWMLNNNVNEYSDAVRSLLYTIVHVGQIGVAIFFMISGYFLCQKHFSFRRITSVIIQTLSYSFAFLILFFILDKFALAPSYIRDMFSDGNLFVTIFRGVMPVFSNAYWFITTYVVLLLLSPFINSLINNISEKRFVTLMIIIALLHVWSICTPFVNFFNPIFYALLCYMAGAWVRICGVRHNGLLSKKQCIAIALLMMLTMVAFNFISLSGAPVAELLGWRKKVVADNGLRIAEIVIALMLFWVCMIRSNKKVASGKASVLLGNISAAIFGVYLIHENQFIYKLLWGTISSSTESTAIGSNFIIKTLLMLFVSMAVYTVCLLIAYLYYNLVIRRLIKIMEDNALIRNISTRVDRAIGDTKACIKDDVSYRL